MFLSILLLSLSMSVDALGIGISYGLRSIKIPLGAKMIIALLSFIVCCISLFLGHGLRLLLSPKIAENIGIIILMAMGIWLIRQGIYKKEAKEKKPPKKEETIFTLLVKSLGITVQIIRTPQYGDLDDSHSIEPKEALYMGLALSLDSFGAYIGGGAIGFSSILMPLFSAFFQILLLCLGQGLGEKISVFSTVKSRTWTVCSGLLLLMIGTLRLLP